MADNAQNTDNAANPQKKGGLFGKIGGWFKNTVGKGFDSITPKVTAVAGKVWDKLESTADKITEKIPGGDKFKESASNAIEKWVNTIGNETKELVEKGKGYVNKKTDQAQEGAEEKTGSLLGDITDRIQKTAEGGVSSVTGVVGKAGDALGSWVNMAQDAAKQGVDAAQQGVKQVQDTATNVAQEAQKQATNVADQVQEKATDAVNKVQDTTEKAVETAQNKVEDTANAVQEKVEQTAEKAEAKAEEVKDNIENKATEMKETVEEKVEDTKEKVEEAGEAVKDAAPEAPATDSAEEKKE